MTILVREPLGRERSLMPLGRSVIPVEELQRHADELRLLVEVSEAIATHRNPTSLFRHLAKQLPAIVPFELIALFLHDPAKQVMRVHMLGSADGDRISPGLEVPVDASFSGLTLRTQQPVIVRNPAEAARFPLTASLVRDLGVESFCMLPLTTTVRPLGAIAFGSTERHRFDQSQMDFLQLVARQVAVAVDNVLHESDLSTAQRELAAERDRLRLLLEVSEAIASHRNLDDLFAALARLLPPVVAFDYINALLHDPVKDVMRLHVLVSPADSTIRPGLELPVDESASGLVWKTQQPLVVDHIDNERRFPQLIAMMRDNGVRSFCAIPLTTALRRLGRSGLAA